MFHSDSLQAYIIDHFWLGYIGDFSDGWLFSSIRVWDLVNHWKVSHVNRSTDNILITAHNIESTT
jgi:hypothetical protein